MTSTNPKKDPAPHSNTEKDPDDWITGDEPMTGAQASYLQTLCEEAGEALTPNLTKAANCARDCRRERRMCRRDLEHVLEGDGLGGNLALRANDAHLGSYGVCVFFHQALYTGIAFTAARERGLAA